MAPYLPARALQARARAPEGRAIAAPRSAGLLLYRRAGGSLEVLLVHPGGPFWKNKDEGAWTIPKGLIDPGEAPLDAARREFTEETGLSAPDGPFLTLTPLRQPSGKLVMAWAAEGDCDPATVCSNLFRMEWPPRSGQYGEFPECDRAGWFSIPAAEVKILKGQRPFLAELERLLRESMR